MPDVIASPALEGLIAVGDPPLGGFFRLLVGPDLESGDVLISQFDTNLSAAVVDVVVPIFVAYGVMDNGRTVGFDKLIKERIWQVVHVVTTGSMKGYPGLRLQLLPLQE